MRHTLKLALILTLVCLVPMTALAVERDYSRLGMINGEDLGLTVHRDADGIVTKLVNNQRVPVAGEPGDVASRFIAENAQTLFGTDAVAKAGGLRVGDVVLETVRVRNSLSGDHVWMQAMVDGVPVHNGYVVTHLTRDGQVLFLTNDLGRPEIDLPQDKSAISEMAAMATARDLIGGDGVTRVPPRAELVVYRADGRDRLAWRTETATYNPYGDWEIFIDAATGAQIARKDLLVCIKPEEKPASIEPPDEPFRPSRGVDKSATVTGTGLVLIANPLNDHPERYSWRDGDPDPDSVLDTVDLNNLDGSGFLAGSWVEVFNSDAARANEPSLVYNYSSLVLNGNFHEVNVYYHIDTEQEYFRSLGILNARAYVTPCYAHQGEDDNSDFSPSQDRIRYGDGGVDDSEDGEIVVHEYGHAIHDDVVPGFVYAGESGAISEGFGDYLGAGFGNNALVGEWDATSYNPGPPPYLRRTDTTKHYPEDIVGQVHSDGEIISGAWWDLRNLVGASVGDQLVFEGMFYTGTSATFQDYADGVVAADQALYGGSHLGYIFQAFGGRGIGPTYLLDINHTPQGDTEDQAGPYAVTATITHTSPVTAPDAVKLYYRYGGAGAFTEVVMAPTGGFDEWGGAIPGPGMITQVDYYLTVTDDAAISGSLPTTAPADVFSFQVGPDSQAPVITHFPLNDKPLMVWPAAVNATITDNGAIASATVSYSLNSVPQTDLVMADMGGGAYSATFPEAAGSLAIGDVFEYTITAVDGSSSANTTTDGPHTFEIIDALGVVLIIDDDTTTKGDVKYDDRKIPRYQPDRDPASKGLSAASMATTLTDAGWVVVEETSAASDPATWPGYSFIVSSSGANTAPVADAAYRAAVEAYVAGGGKLLSEGGEVAYDAISFPAYPTYADNVVHGFDWDGDDSGPLVVVPGMETHPIMSNPNPVAGSLPINYSGFGDQDSYKQNPDSYVVMGTTDEPANAGIMVFDDNPNPASAQIVHYAFNFAAVADPAEAAKLLQNTALFLIASEAAGTASISGEVTVAGASDGGVLIEASPGGFSTLTNPDGTYMLTGLYGGTYTVTATLAGYGTAPQTVMLVDGEAVTGVNFGLGAVLEFNYCEPAALAIPDNSPAGVTSQILVTDGDILTDINCSVDITHTYRGDLIVELTSPAGTVVRLANRTGGSSENIVANYDVDTAPDGPGAMSDFDGENPVGYWTLFVSDNAGVDIGVLNEWCLNVFVTDIVVANEIPRVDIAENGGQSQLSWNYAGGTVDAFNVYRRVAGGERIRLNAAPLTSSDGRIEFTDDISAFEEGTLLYYSVGLIRDGREIAVGDEIELKAGSSLPTKFVLHDNFPNPFNPLTKIRFDLPRSEHVSLRIFDISGRAIKTLVDDVLARQSHEYRWDGTDDTGRRVASGTYYYRVQTERTTETGKMMLVK